MKKIVSIIFSLFVLHSSFFLAACCGKKKAIAQSSKEIKRDFENEGYIKATVIFYEVSGCEYVLKLEDEKKLEPSNLAADYKKDQLAVWLKYISKKGGMSVCMAGQMVDIIDIQLRK